MSTVLGKGRRAGAWALLAAASGVAAGLLAPPATGLTTAASGVGTAKVNVVHGIPGVAVKICVDGAAVVDNFRYGHTIVGATLPATTHRVRVVAAGSPCGAAAILKSRYTLTKGHDYTIVANVNPAGKPNLEAFGNNVTPVRAGAARLTIRHTADAPAVNVWADGTKIVGGRKFTWGKSATLAVPAGSYRVKVTLPGSKKPVIGPVTKTLRAGRAYQVYAVGVPGHYRVITVKTHVGSR